VWNGRRDSRAAVGAVRALRARALVLRSARRAGRRPPPAGGRSRPPCAGARVGLGEALRVDGVDDDRVRARVRRRREAVLELERLVDPASPRAARPATVPGTRRVGEHLRDPVAPGRRIGPTRAISPNVRGVVSIAMPVAGGRRVDRPTRSYGALWPVPALASGPSSHTLAIVISSLAPGAAADEVLERVRVPSSRPCGGRRRAVSTALLQRRWGSMVIAHRTVGELDLLLAAHARGGRTRATSGPARDLAARSSGDPRGGRQPDRGGDGRLADAALAGHVHERCRAGVLPSAVTG
jgi:hypothetical protein